MHPDTLICPQFKSCTLINFWLRDKLYRYTAQVPATKFVTGDKFAAPINLAPPLLNKICTWMAKATPYPPCTVIAFWPAKWRVLGLCPVLSSGNTTSPHIAGPLVATPSEKIASMALLIIFLKGKYK